MSQGSYWWFEGKSVEKLTEALIDAGEGARLEVHPIGDDKIHLVVVPPGHPGKDPINDSHICPPSCP